MNAWRIVSRTGIAALVGALVGPIAGATADEDTPAFSSEAVAFFETQIRPLLVENCLSCHGPDQQKAGLRLDSREAILKGGLTGSVVEPGDPESSPLVWAVEYTEEPRMPPKGKLPDHQIEALSRWVAMGAPWTSRAEVPLDRAEMEAKAQQHWSFRPVVDPDLPEVEDRSGFVRTPIDRFVLRKLDQHGLIPSPPADRRTWIRRVSFDLNGLPPTPEEVEAYLADDAPDAEAKLVDRLLASPHYGERWGRHWLDLARYADTKGYVFQNEPRFAYAYTYRDYVIKAFNEDKPYDQFVREQLAADLVEPSDPSAQAALGFLTIGRRFGTIHDLIDDRIDVTTRGFLGLSVACARCHDHKYDPVPTADYYSLYGVLGSGQMPDEADLPRLPESQPHPDRDAYLAARTDRQAKLDQQNQTYLAQIQADLRDRIDDYLRAAEAVQFNVNDGQGRDRISRQHKLRPESLRFLLTALAEHLKSIKPESASPLLPWIRLASLPAEEFPARAVALLDELRAISKVPEDLLEVLADPPLQNQADLADRYAKLILQARDLDATDPQDSCRDQVQPAHLTSLGETFFGPEGIARLSLAELPRLVNRAERQKIRSLQKRIDQLAVDHPGAPPRAMVYRDRERPIDPYVFLRGSPGRRGPKVPRQFLGVLEGPDRKPFQEGSGRLELAEKIASPENPLTARVLVNRIWTHHFGAGLVRSPSDFGTRSDPPSHPELLDYLATRFVEDGWSIKSLHRRILLSSTYRQASALREPAAQVDPENRLLWRFTPRRLEFEPMRDALLAVSGRLDPTLGGRSINVLGDRPSHRRSVYAFIDRLNVPALLRTFDVANPNVSIASRSRTTVPQQALWMMNAPFVIQRATDLVERFATLPDDQRIDRMHRQLYGRPAEDRDLGLARRFLESYQDLSPSRFLEDPSRAWSYGYGGIDESTERVIHFSRLPYWKPTEASWQFGPEVPDPVGHYLFLQAKRAHVGVRADEAAIVRWTAPAAMTVSVKGLLKHTDVKGDGVRGRLVSDRAGVLGTWIAHNRQQRWSRRSIRVTEGETLDWVVDGRSGHGFDSFEWSMSITAETRSGDGPSIWDAQRDFHGPLPSPLSAWQAYAHALLMSNEFLFID